MSKRQQTHLDEKCRLETYQKTLCSQHTCASLVVNCPHAFKLVSQTYTKKSIGRFPNPIISKIVFLIIKDEEKPLIIHNLLDGIYSTLRKPTLLFTNAVNQCQVAYSHKILVLTIFVQLTHNKYYVNSKEKSQHHCLNKLSLKMELVVITK